MSQSPDERDGAPPDGAPTPDATPYHARLFADARGRVEPTAPSPTIAADEPIWHDENVHVTRLPNVCRLQRERDSIAVLFGFAQTAPPPPTLGTHTPAADGRMHIHLRERVVLAPVAAKLLARLLDEAISEHEAEHGEVALPMRALPGSARLRSSEARPQPLLPHWPDDPRQAEKAKLLFQLLTDANLPFSCERSIKFHPSQMNAGRFLLSLPRSAVTPQLLTRLPVLCRRLGMPQALRQSFEAAISDCDFLHFGFEDEAESCLFKAYTEYARTLLDAQEAARSEPFELYRGFKWDAFDPNRQAESRYRCFPSLDAAAIAARVADLLPEASAPAELVAGLLRCAGHRVDPRRLIYLEVDEPDNPRRSFDLNVYDAGIQLAEIYPWLLRLTDAFGLSAAEFEAVYRPVREQRLGHVAAGVDRSGAPFFTVYFGGRPS